MIPKIIHYTWFSDDPYPEKIKECMKSWKIHMPDYQFIHWDMEKIKDIKVPFLKEALKKRNGLLRQISFVYMQYIIMEVFI